MVKNVFKTSKLFSSILIVFLIGTSAKGGRTSELIEELNDACKNVSNHTKTCGFRDKEDITYADSHMYPPHDQRCESGSKYSWCTTDRKRGLERMEKAQDALFKHLKQKKLRQKEKNKEKETDSESSIVKEEESLLSVLRSLKKRAIENGKRTEELKKYIESKVQTTDILEKEKEEIILSINSLKKTQEEKEKEINKLQEEREKTTGYIKEIMKVIGVETKDFGDCTGEIFVKKCLDKLKSEIKSI